MYKISKFASKNTDQNRGRQQQCQGPTNKRSSTVVGLCAEDNETSVNIRGQDGGVGSVMNGTR